MKYLKLFENFNESKLFEFINIENLEKVGYKLIDYYKYEPYEIFLAEVNEHLKNFLSSWDLPFYQIGLERLETDSTIPEEHNKTMPLPENFNLKEFLEKVKFKINEWVKKYGKILISSNNDRKINFYKKILKKMNINYKEINEPFKGLIIN